MLIGGERVPGAGFFYRPSVLADVPLDSPGWKEELFGPVAVLKQAKNLDEAIALANDNEYGLGSSAWTSVPEEEARFIDELEAGMTFINSMVASDPRLPFGGVKHSGYGRELYTLGMREFMSIKTVSVNRGSSYGRTSSE